MSKSISSYYTYVDRYYFDLETRVLWEAVEAMILVVPSLAAAEHVFSLLNKSTKK